MSSNENRTSILIDFDSDDSLADPNFTLELGQRKRRHGECCGAESESAPKVKETDDSDSPPSKKRCSGANKGKHILSKPLFNGKYFHNVKKVTYGSPVEEGKSRRISNFQPQKVTRLSLSLSRRVLSMPSRSQTAEVQEEVVLPRQNFITEEEQNPPIPISVQAMLFLQTRPMSKQHGSLLVALDNGTIQVYSHHHSGGFITDFSTIHKTGDCVISMTTDVRNKYLFTGTAFGYIKIWLMQNFCVPENEKKHICMPKLRLQFIFLRKDRFAGRAKRMVRGQKEPMLLNSFKGHIKSVTSLVYIDKTKMIATGSHDYSCRLWSLGGRYLGTLGSPVPWMKLSPTAQINEDDTFRIPPDIKKVASSTTLKVITGSYRDRFREMKEEAKMREMEQTLMETAGKCVYGKPLMEPLLGKHFELPPRARYIHQPVLDKSLPYIPVYSHLQVHPATPVERPPTPEALKKTKKLEFMEYYNPKKK